VVAVQELMDTDSCACLCLHAGYVKSSSFFLGGGCLFLGFLNVCKSVVFHMSLATPPRRMEECLIE
jgi:hypothetical protein